MSISTSLRPFTNIRIPSGQRAAMDQIVAEVSRQTGIPAELGETLHADLSVRPDVGDPFYNREFVQASGYVGLYLESDTPRIFMEALNAACRAANLPG